MAGKNANAVLSGAGTLLIAPSGSPYPGTLTAAWPSAWTELGYTTEGSTFSFETTTADIVPAEEFYRIKQVVTAKNVTVSFALMQDTATNLSYALNGGTIDVAGVGYVKFTPPEPGDEVRHMIGWDADDELRRFVFYQAFNGGSLEIAHAKGENVSTLATEWAIEKVAGLPIFDAYYDDTLLV